MYGEPPMSLEEVEQQTCTKCKATRGNPCVYIPPMAYGRPQPRTWSTEMSWARVGQPTKRPHGERYNATRRARAQAYAAEQLRQAKIIPPDVADRIAIHDAETKFDVIERRKLVWWLSRYSALLTHQLPPPVDQR